MQIIFITPEAVPFSRVGGLGDVCFQLPRSLAQKGHEVTVLAPKHRGSDKMPLKEIESWQIEIDLSLSRRQASFFNGETNESHRAVLVGCDELFDRPGIYGNEFGDYDDNAERFIFFCRAALIAADKICQPDQDAIIHCHDWAAALVPMCLRSWQGKYTNLKDAATVFTYHNLANQGLFLHYDFAMTGLDWNLFTHEGLEFHGRMNLSKAGLIAADIITTVSNKYAEESLSPEFGLGLEGVLRSRLGDIFAVQHGVDYQQWDPSTDKYIAANYSYKDMAGKNECRSFLSKLFGFNDSDKPTVGMVCRLLQRKGLDIIVRSMDELAALDINIAIMGMGENHYQDFLRKAASKYAGRVGYKCVNDQTLSHHIMAGADIFLMPSRFEPCGLEQLYALRYGTVPVVRGTGGLDDTIIDIQENPQTGTGYKFYEFSPDAFLQALKKAISDFKDQKSWKKTMSRGMEQEFSWQNTAASYEKIYRHALDKRKL